MKLRSVLLLPPHAHILLVVNMFLTGFDSPRTNTLYVDKKIYPFIEGLNIDYVKQGLQAKFVYQNPKFQNTYYCKYHLVMMFYNSEQDPAELKLMFL
jgi:hypothetical protein